MIAQRGVPDLLVYLDGGMVPPSVSGAGAGVISALPSALYVGSNGTALYSSGLVSRVVMCRKAGGCR